MDYRRSKDTIIIRVQRGEWLLEVLKQICEKEQIMLGEISGIGACDEAVVGLYDVEKKEYHKSELKGEMELVSLLGNVTRKDGEVYLHCHASFSTQEGGLAGGHLNEAKISGTGELFLRVLEGSVLREYDEETGLNLFAF